MTTVQAGVASSRAAPAWHALPILDTARELRVDAQVGLTTEEAERRREEVGPNTLTAAAPEPRWTAVTRQYGDPLQIVLVMAGVVALALGEVATALTVLLVTAVNAVFGLLREGEPTTAVAVLQRSLIGEARVRRDGALQSIAAERLVPGDVVLIAAGDIVPADGRLLESATLEVDESALTGVRSPVAKGVELVDDAAAPLGDRTDMVYSTTRVIRGASEFVVTAIGMSTEVSRISALLRPRAATTTPLSAGLMRLTGKLIAIAGAALVVSAALNLARGHTFETVAMAAVAFAVAAVPAGLPAVFAALLARASRALATGGVIVNRLRALELLGAMSTLAVEKAGTLTLGQMTAVGRGGGAPLRDLRDGLPRQRRDPVRRRRAAGAARALLAPVGAGNGSRGRRRRADRRSERGGARGLGREGRDLGRRHSRGAPADRRAAVRRRPQADGDVPPHHRRGGGRGRPLLRQGGAGGAARPVREDPRPRAAAAAPLR